MKILLLVISGGRCCDYCIVRIWGFHFFVFEIKTQIKSDNQLLSYGPVIWQDYSIVSALVHSNHCLCLCCYLRFDLGLTFRHLRFKPAQRLKPSTPQPRQTAGGFTRVWTFTRDYGTKACDIASQCREHEPERGSGFLDLLCFYFFSSLPKFLLGWTMLLLNSSIWKLMKLNSWMVTSPLVPNLWCFCYVFNPFPGWNGRGLNEICTCDYYIHFPLPETRWGSHTRSARQGLKLGCPWK